MQKNNWKLLLIGLVALIFIIVSFSGGFILGQFIPILNNETIPTLLDRPGSNQDNAQASATPDDLEEIFKPFWESWGIVEEQFVDQPVDQTEMMRGAIQGMLESLGDQHTSYMDPDMFQQQSTPLEGEYDGIGAWVDVNGEYVTIISPMPNSPAEEAGLKPDDQVIAVNGEDKTGIDGNVVLRDILGKAGTEVTLTIFRPGTMESFDVTIIRQKIEIPSVVSKMLDDNIAYIQLVNFGDKTHADLKNQLKDLLKNNPRGIILDLRNNGGGYLNTAIEVTSEFVSESPLMIEEFGDGTRTTYKAKPNGIATKIPMVVLINEGSASASEIMAGAIQDYGRAILVGKQSYGKGSVQNWIPLKNDQGAVRVTIARWLTPKERQINEIGLAPDVEVEFTEEDFNAEIDPQLDKAIELLLEQTKN